MKRSRIRRVAGLAALCITAVLTDAPGAGALAPYRATITADRRTTWTGTTVRFAGVVPAAARSKTVALQVVLRGAWRNVATARVTPSRRYAVLYAPTVPGELRFRVRIAGDRVRATGASPSVTVVARRPSPVTVAELRNLILPASVCSELDIPRVPHRLVNGQYDYPATTSNIYLESPTVGDLDGDGVNDGAFAYGCFNGVADHISEVRVVLAGGRRQLDVALARPFRTDIPVLDARQENVNDVNAVAISGRRVKVSMYWGFMSDPTCCPTASAFGAYAFTGRYFARTQLTRIDDVYRTRVLVDALNARNLALVGRLVGAPALDVFGDGYVGGARFGRISCSVSSSPPYHSCLFQSSNGIAFFATWSGSLSRTVAGALGTATISAAYPGD